MALAVSWAGILSLWVDKSTFPDCETNVRTVVPGIAECMGLDESRVVPIEDILSADTYPEMDFDSDLEKQIVMMEIQAMDLYEESACVDGGAQGDSGQFDTFKLSWVATFPEGEEGTPEYELYPSWREKENLPTEDFLTQFQDCVNPLMADPALFVLWKDQFKKKERSGQAEGGGGGIGSIPSEMPSQSPTRMPTVTPTRSPVVPSESPTEPPKEEEESPPGTGTAPFGGVGSNSEPECDPEFECYKPKLVFRPDPFSTQEECLKECGTTLKDSCKLCVKTGPPFGEQSKDEWSPAESCDMYCTEECGDGDPDTAHPYCALGPIEETMCDKDLLVKFAEVSEEADNQCDKESMIVTANKCEKFGSKWIKNYSGGEYVVKSPVKTTSQEDMSAGCLCAMKPSDDSNEIECYVNHPEDANPEAADLPDFDFDDANKSAFVGICDRNCKETPLPPLKSGDSSDDGGLPWWAWFLIAMALLLCCCLWLILLLLCCKKGGESEELVDELEAAPLTTPAAGAYNTTPIGAYAAAPIAAAAPMAVMPPVIYNPSPAPVVYAEPEPMPMMGMALAEEPAPMAAAPMAAPIGVCGPCGAEGWYASGPVKVVEEEASPYQEEISQYDEQQGLLGNVEYGDAEFGQQTSCGGGQDQGFDDFNYTL